MSSNISSIDTSLETPLTRMIKFVLFSAPLGPSLCCSLYIFFHNRNTFVRHDLPILVVFFSLIIWYVILILTHPCKTHRFDGNKFVCGGPCFNDNVITATVDWILIVLLPALLIVTFNTVLLVRVLIKKHRRHLGLVQRTDSWRKNIKLFIQLLSVSLVYLIAQVPLVIISLVHLFGPDDFLIDISHIWLYYMPYLIYLVSPFAYVATTKDYQKHLCKWQNRIQPVAAVPLDQ